MTLKGLWIRGFCTVGIAVATQADAVFTHWSDEWGVKEWVHAISGIAVVLFIAVRGFKDQSATDYKNSLADDCLPDVPIDASERVPVSKTRQGRTHG